MNEQSGVALCRPRVLIEAEMTIFLKRKRPEPVLVKTSDNKRFTGKRGPGFEARPGDINRKGRPPVVRVPADALRRFLDMDLPTFDKLLKTPLGELMARKDWTAMDLWAAMHMMAGTQSVVKGFDVRERVFDRVGGRPAAAVDVTSQGEPFSIATFVRDNDEAIEEAARRKREQETGRG